MSAKRVADILFSLIGLVVFSPVFIFLIWRGHRVFGGSAFFEQYRPGQNAELFRMFKFKTMNDACDENGILLSDALRLNNWGKALRASSLDELPEFWNVLKGEMSLVGPRPLLKEYLPLYSVEQSRRHEVRPGITGWAQVNGRNALSWDEKFDLDIWYVDNKNFWLDIKIIFLTVRKVFLSEGISAPGEATMAPFTGSTNITSQTTSS